MMSVDLDSHKTFLVADTSVLIRSLPMVRAVIESSQAYTVYIPYIVLTELDQGSTAAPVNKLLCRHMKQRNPRVLAQSVIGHKEVTQADGVTQKNDDLILGAALKLKEEGFEAILLTNDNNLSVKACANGLSTWSSLDFICKLNEAIPEMDRFITKDLRELCPHAQQLFAFCTELFTCALRFRLKQQDQLTSNNNGIIYRLMEKAKEQKIVSDSELITRCERFIRECRRKSRNLAYEEVQRFLRYVCAILELLKKDRVIARILNVCKGIFTGLKSSPRAKSGATLTSSIVENRTRKHFDSMSDKQKKRIVEIVAKVDTKRKKSDGIKKNTTKRKSLSTAINCDSDDDDDGMDTDDESTLDQKSSVDGAATGALIRGQSSSRKLSATLDMEIDSMSKRPHQAFGPMTGDDIKQHPAYRMLETVWIGLHNISGTWASKCGVDYAWRSNLQTDMKPELTTLKEFAETLGQIDADYSRLLKLGNSVAPELLLTVAKRFIDTLRKVCAHDFSVTAQEVVQFFQDDRTSDILLNGRSQLQAFREAIVQCRSKATEKVLHRLSNEKLRS